MERPSGTANKKSTVNANLLPTNAAETNTPSPHLQNSAVQFLTFLQTLSRLLNAC
jgi:hypothetical protein